MMLPVVFAIRCLRAWLLVLLLSVERWSLHVEFWSHTGIDENLMPTGADGALKIHSADSQTVLQDGRHTFRAPMGAPTTF